MDFQHFDDIEDSTGDLQWRRSSRCGTGACVDVARDGDKIAVRDGKFGAVSNTLTFSVSEWLQVLEAVRHGKDHPDIRVADGGVWFGGDGNEDYDLFFNSAEWRAFEEGVLLWEFEPDRLSTSAPASEGEQVADEVGSIADGSDLAATGADKEESVSGGTAPVAAQPAGDSEWAEIVARTKAAAEDASDAVMDAYLLGVQRGAERSTAPALWDPTSPQHTVIRAAIAWRNRVADAVARGGAQPEVWADAEDLALIEAVDALPHIGEREPEPAWGSGPLVDHNPETPGTGSADPDGGQR